MKNIIKFSLLAVFMFSDFVMFADPGDDDNNGGGGLEGSDPAPAPINGKLIILLVLGVIFAFYKIKSALKKA
ncbi:hypothetical protein [Flavobacterium sp.]|uniref:hypothetical protein n=1 Tax=Flavobacterium sp. TaxID=239 RepID=UPI003752D268